MLNKETVKVSWLLRKKKKSVFKKSRESEKKKGSLHIIYEVQNSKILE